MLKGNKLRVGLVAVLCASTLFVLGKSILYPNQKRTHAIKFSLPQVVSLSGWKLQANHSLVDNQRGFQSGRTYLHVRNRTTLNIEIRYLVNTDGDVRHYLKAYKSITLTQSPTIRHRQGIGFYGLFTEQNKSYLSACINPRGGSTFTGTQFSRNRNTLDIQPGRIVPWLFGQSELRDYRCLWIHLSVPVEGNPDHAYQTLEAAWLSGSPTWILQFQDSSNLQAYSVSPNI